MHDCVNVSVRGNVDDVCMGVDSSGSDKVTVVDKITVVDEVTVVNRVTGGA